jgi:PAS domain S-box-containing protein
VECDAENKPILLYGIAQDITERKESEKELKVKDSAIESSISGVGIADLEGKLIYVNDSLLKMWGFENREEVLGRNLPEFWEGEGVLKTVQELREKGWSIGEDVGKRKDGSLFSVQYFASMIRDESGHPLYMYGSFLDITEQKRDREALRDLSGRLINAQEDERSRIARELHDDVSQRLALLAVELDLAGQSQQESEKGLHEKMKGLSARVKELSTDIHHLSYRLHPRNIERLGLSVALKSLCREISEQQELPLGFTSDQNFDSVPDDVALCLYRVAQESLQNVVKHSQAKDARVVLSRGTNEIHLLVSDSGIGFDPDEAHGRKSLGIISMRERLHAIGGRLSIRSEPGGGTQIECFVPLNVKDEAGD